MRHHRLVFFLGLYLVYVSVLYGYVGIRDPGHDTRIIARLLLPAAELGLCALLCAWCLRWARAGNAWPWLLACWAIAGAAAVIYLAQVYSLYLSRNFISVLAMENADSNGFVTSPKLLLAAVAGGAWLALFCRSTWSATRPGSVPAGAERWGRWRFGTVLFLCALVSLYALFIQDRNRRLEPGFRQSPMANFVVNAWHARMGRAAEPPPAAARLAGAGAMRCFEYGDDGPAGAYPFQRAGAFRSPLPFPSRPGAVRRPNVLVLFSEGISSRLLGAYGGNFPGLTPNIDALAALSMQVEDYFNHTAATFRGVGGQLYSGYAYAGGGGKEGWIHAGNQQGLAGIRRQALPTIFRDAGYDTFFFAPHKADRPIILMLRTLGFGKVFTYESTRDELLGGEIVQRPGTGAMTDKSLFAGVVSFLRHRAATGNTAPFFAATYNIGTHAFLEGTPLDVRYGDAGNAALDKLHNYDAALGQFLRYFLSSPYADNTILVFTSDHATYPEPPYREVAGPDLKPYFVDRIPLLVRDPVHELPKRLDADGRNSLALAPTVLQLAGVQARSTSFLGRSLFEPRNFPAGVAALGGNYYLTTPGGVFAQGEIPENLRGSFACEVEVVRRYYEMERANRLVRPLLEP